MAIPAKRLHILLGGTANGDKAKLDKSFRSKRGRAWIVPKGARIGEEVVIFIGGHGFYATGRIDSEPRLRQDWHNRYGAAIRRLRPISPPISLNIIRQQIPALKWANYPRSITTPKADVAAQIRTLIQRRRRQGMMAESAKDLSGLNLAELKALALSKSSTASSKKNRTVTQRTRSEAIKQYVLKRANGHCEGCGKRAPFRTPTGTPYLEPHHTTRLADGGPDHPRHVIALCPNCHRRAHSSGDRIAFNNGLKKKIRRIELLR